MLVLVPKFIRTPIIIAIFVTMQPHVQLQLKLEPKPPPQPSVQLLAPLVL